ncbi:MAG TPA: PA14 domain-containing protein [Abditibacteriaceae bacterium]
MSRLLPLITLGMAGLAVLGFSTRYEAQTQQAAPALPAQRILRDDFNTFDGSRWSLYTRDNFIGRTRMGNRPTVLADRDGTRFVRLRLDSHNPDFPGAQFRGTEFRSHKQYQLQGGKEFIARVRVNNSGGGIVPAFYTHGARGVWNTPDRISDEIDFEFLGNNGIDKPLLTVWNDWNQRFNPTHQWGLRMANWQPPLTGMNWGHWNIYRIRWLNDRVEWYVNDVMVQTTKGALAPEAALLPDDPMNVHFNIWAADEAWREAYDGRLQPTSDGRANQSSSLDVDWVEVRDLGAPRGASLGQGSGLMGRYYRGASLTGAPVMSRVDARVHFDWNIQAPHPALDADNFSVRWTGRLVAPKTETYTFYARADDGVRLWVNNKLLINAWKNQAPTEYRASMRLRRGQKYNLKMEYYDSAEAASAQLGWNSPSTFKQPIPQSQLFPS